MIVGTLLAVWTLPVIANNAVLGASQMIATPAKLQGRVGAAFGLIIGLTPILGASSAGLLLDNLGWQFTIMLATGIGIGGLTIAIFSQALREIINEQNSPQHSSGGRASKS